ncbi:XRE family transcriptional regulator [Lactococcus allomyrinae]|uniref:XRE family transcriptional regulator n=2 Tax=Lactococcus allomyrinae TaxID=2419773 RepID=A0A387BDI1_9LACT|nr:XRE family transcriptional regulator [Lactococcus allomyrinae]
MTFTAIAEKADMEDYTLYRLRQRPSKLNGEIIAKISNATGLDETKLFEISYFFAQKVDISQRKVS